MSESSPDDFQAIMNRIEAPGAEDLADGLDEWSWPWKDIADGCAPMDTGACLIDLPRPQPQNEHMVPDMVPLQSSFKRVSFASGLDESSGLQQLKRVSFSSQLQSAASAPPLGEHPLVPTTGALPRDIGPRFTRMHMDMPESSGGPSRPAHKSNPEEPLVREIPLLQIPTAGAKPSETNPMLNPYIQHVLADLLKSDEFLSAVTAHGKRLQHNLPAPVIQASLAKDLARSKSKFNINLSRECSGELSKGKRRVSESGNLGDGKRRVSESISVAGSGRSGKLAAAQLQELSPLIPALLAKETSAAGAGLLSGDRRQASGGAGKGSGSGRLDTTHRKKQDIAKLEQEVRDKLILIRELEEEKEQLLCKEKTVLARAQQLNPSLGKGSSEELLGPHAHKLSVNASEIPRTIVDMINTFGSQAGRGKAAEVLKGFTTSDQFTIKEYCAVLCGSVEELSDIVKQQQNLGEKKESLESELHPLVSARLSTVVPKIESFVHAAIVLYAPLTLYSLSCDIRDPSVTLIRDTDFWTSVREKMHLTTVQEDNLRSIYHTYASLMQKETDNAAKVLAEIIANSQQSDRDASSKLTCNTSTIRSNRSILESLYSFWSINQRFMILSSMLTFLIMTSLSPWQKALAWTLSFPSAPDLKLILASLCHKES